MRFFIPSLCCFLSAPLLADEPRKVAPIARLGSLNLVHPDLRDMEFTLDGKRLVSVGSTGLFVWDVATGEERWRFDLEERGAFRRVFSISDREILISGYTSSLVLDLEGRKEVWSGNLAVVTLSGNRTRMLVSKARGQFAVHDTGDKTQVGKTFHNTEEIVISALSRDGNVAALADEDGAVTLYDVRTGKALAKRPAERGDEDNIHIVGMHFTKGDDLLLARTNGQVKLLDGLTFTEEFKFQFSKRADELALPSRRTGLSRDDAYLAVSHDDTTELFEVRSGKKMHGFPGFSSNLCVSDDGRLLATTSIRNPIRLWNLKTGKSLDEKAGARTALLHAAISAKTKTVLAINAAGSGMVWSLDGKPRRHFGLGDTTRGRSLLFRDHVCQGNKKIAMMIEFGFLDIWDLDRQDWHSKIFLGKRFFPDRFAMAQDDETLAAIDFGADAKDKPRVHVFRGGKEVQQFPLEWKLSYKDHMELAPDGKRLIACSPEELCIWDLETGKKLASRKASHDHFPRLCFSPDGKFFYHVLRSAKVAKGAVLHEADSATGKAMRSLGQVATVVRLAASPTGKFLATADHVGQIQLWDLKAGKLASILEGHRGFVTSLQFNTELGLLASSSDDTTALIWDMKALGVE